MSCLHIVCHIAGAVLVSAAGAGILSSAAAQTLAPATLTVFMQSCQQAACNNGNTYDIVAAYTGSGAVNSFTYSAESFSPNGSTLLEIGKGNDGSVINYSQVNSGNNPFTYAVGGGGNNVTVTASTTPSPSLTITSTSNGPVNGSTNGYTNLAQVTLTYQLEVSGSGALVPITVNSVGTTSGAGTGSLTFINTITQLSITGVLPNSDDAQLLFSCANGSCTNQNFTQGTGFIPVVSTSAETGGFNETGTYAVNLNQVYAVTLTGLIQCGGSTNSTCSMSIPSVTIGVPAGYQLLLSPGVGNSAPALVSAVLPTSRSVTVGNTATAFATIINSGPGNALLCAITPQTNIPANFFYQTTDPNTNALTGTVNTPVNIPQGQFQSFVIGLTPTGAFSPATVAFSFPCTNSGAAPQVNGLNTLLLSASTTPTPDVIALAATLQNDGIVHVTSGSPLSGAFAVAADNLGSGDTITIATNTGSATLPITVLVCQTNSSTGACLQTPASSVSTLINPGATPTFGIFVTATGTVPFDPANNRVFVTFTDSTMAIRGETSVAVETR